MKKVTYSVNTKGEREELSVADIKKELFENENIVLDKNTDHGFSELTMNKDKDDMENVD